jgi:hypothetical protein
MNTSRDVDVVYPEDLEKQAKFNEQFEAERAYWERQKVKSKLNHINNFLKDAEHYYTSTDYSDTNNKYRLVRQQVLVGNFPGKFTLNHKEAKKQYIGDYTPTQTAKLFREVVDSYQKTIKNLEDSLNP